MEIRDGFIVSIFNYCDRWCERCELTAYCRLFADVARDEAAADPQMSAVVHAPLLPQDQPPPPPPWLEQLMEEAHRATDTDMPAPEDRQAVTPALALEHKAIYERALAYGIWVREWLDEREPTATTHGAADPLATISWFSWLTPAKIRRSLTGLAAFDGDREFPPDHEGSAKVALIGLDRSLEAWRQLAAEHRVAESVARPCIDELSWIRARLEAAIPYAPAFVRPGFDEPEALQELLDVEGVR